MSTSYKSFQGLNESLGSLTMSARANAAISILNIVAQYESAVSDLPQNWARGLSGVIQQEYDENGHITDVTPTEAISTVDTQLYNAKNLMLSIKARHDSLLSQFQSVTSQATVNVQSLGNSEFNFVITPGNAVEVYLGKLYHSQLNAQVQFYLEFSSSNEFYVSWDPESTPIRSGAVKCLFSDVGYIFDAADNDHITILNGTVLYDKYFRGFNCTGLDATHHYLSMPGLGWWRFSISGTTISESHINLTGLGGDHNAVIAQPLSIGVSVDQNIDQYLSLPDPTDVLQELDSLINS